MRTGADRQVALALALPAIGWPGKKREPTWDASDGFIALRWRAKRGERHKSAASRPRGHARGCRMDTRARDTFAGTRTLIQVVR